MAITYHLKCPYCHSVQIAEHPGDFVPIYVRCTECDNRFIVEPGRDGVKTYTQENVPCCSDPECRELEMGDSGNE